jgi:TonB family protein
MSSLPDHPEQQPDTKGNRPDLRPGAMTVAMQAVQIRPTGPKVLRIGLIQGGKIGEERIIRRRETVAIGTSERNHFVIHAPGMPSKFDVFQVIGDEYYLNFTDHMSGKIALSGGVQDLASLRSSGAAKDFGTYWQVRLNDNSRGKLVMGDTSLLFQFVVPPPVPLRPQLPATVRGGLIKDMDWLFVAFIFFSFMTHFGFVVYLDNADWPIKEDADVIPRSIRGMIFNEPPPPPEEEKPAEEGAGEDKPAEPSPSKRAEASPKKSDAAPGEKDDVATSAEARARIAQEASQAAEALLLGALGEKGGALADVLAGGAVTGNAEDVLAQASGVGVAQSSGGALRMRSGGGTGSGGGKLGSLAAVGTGGAQGEGGAMTERAIRGKINFEDGDDIGGTGQFDQAVVVRMIRARLRAIQSCYERELRRNPSLAGKVVVEFTIETTGTVTGAKSTANTTGDDAVAACVVGAVSRFRFNDPAPEGGSVRFSYPFVFAPQN